jgi:P63C domain
MNFSLETVEFQIASEIRVNAEGKATFSLRAVARMADVSVSSISEGVRLETSKLAVFLESRGLEGVRLGAFGLDGVPDIAAALILEYYAYEAGRYKTEQASQVFRAFAATGIRAYAHKLTGWKQEQPAVLDYQQALNQVLQKQLPEVATTWECRFSKRFWRALYGCYGLTRDQWICGQFINKYVYGYFPIEVQKRLKEINPLSASGTRSTRLHQHFEDTLLKLLLAHIDTVCLLLETSKNNKDFKYRMNRIPKIKFNEGNVRLLAGSK